MKNKSDSSTPTPQDLLEDLRVLVADAEKLVGNTISEQSEEAIDALRERYEAAQERLGEYYTVARKKVIAGAKSTDEAIRTHPYQSLAIALGAGVLIGVLLSRRSR